MPVSDQGVLNKEELEVSISKLAKLYREAVDGGDQGLAEENRKALELLAEGQAAIAKASIIAAFVSDSDA